MCCFVLHGGTFDIFISIYIFGKGEKSFTYFNMAFSKQVDSNFAGFRHPFTCLCIGPTMAGKTQYLANLIKYKDQVIFPNVKRVIYSYKRYQPIFDTMDGVEFVQGYDFKLDSEIPTLLIMDDQMLDGCNHKLIEMFSVNAHHDNCSIIFVSQVLFHQDQSYRSACQNAMYLILFKSPRHKSQVGHLARQMFTGKRAKELEKAFEDATLKPYSNMILDFRPDTPDLLRFRSNILPHEGEPFGSVKLAHVYII